MEGLSKATKKLAVVDLLKEV